MKYRNGNYAAFYVDEPFSDSNLGANTAKDFCYYRMLCAWKESDSAFPFVDSHEKTYSVRDGSKWETLKQRLHDRLSLSKNVILFLSENTKSSKALTEEINYGIRELGLPIIVVYPDYKEEWQSFKEYLNANKDTLWGKLKEFKLHMDEVPTLHIPFKKSTVKAALENPDFKVQSKAEAGVMCIES